MQVNRHVHIDLSNGEFPVRIDTQRNAEKADQPTRPQNEGDSEEWPWIKGGPRNLEARRVALQFRAPSLT